MAQNSSGINTLYVCPVYWGCSVHWGDTMSTSSVHRGISRIHWGDIMMYMEDIMSTLGDVQYIRIFNIN